MAVAKGKLTATDNAIGVVTIALQAAPQMPAAFPNDPDIEGHDIVIREVEGAPPMQAARGASGCHPRFRNTLPAAVTSSYTHEALLHQPLAHRQRPPGPPASSAVMKEGESRNQMPPGLSDHTMNSEGASAEWERGRGGWMISTYLPPSPRSPHPRQPLPREEAPPRLPEVALAVEGARSHPR